MLTNKFGSLVFVIKTKSYGKMNTIFIKIKENSLEIMWQVAAMDVRSAHKKIWFCNLPYKI